MKKALSFLLTATLFSSFPAVYAEEAVTTEPSPEITTYTPEKPAVDVPKINKGDTNGDGKVTETDFLRYKHHLLGYKNMITISEKTDINKDGKIDILDMIKVRNVLDGFDMFWTLDNIPVMDGSTSAVPLEAGFKSRMLDITWREANLLVDHHKTHEAFSMLLSGETDMIFTVPISESQRQAAIEAGVELNFVPVAKEAFVFIVNQNNPVDTLTTEQIKGIYSGEITNWKDVGGNDEPIIAYQRNADSGSQNLIVEFMGDRKLMDAETHEKFRSPVTSMGGLIDRVIDYDNTEQAIGYSVYSYAAQMYENSSEVKFIAVDGIKPSKETIADNTYPLISSTYALFTDKATQNVKAFVNWAASYEGQMCALENGYLPVKDIEIPENLKPYTKSGTGYIKDKDYKPSYLRSYISGQLDITEKVNFLTDKKVQEKINNDITETLKTDTFNPNLHGRPGMNYEILNGYMSVIITTQEKADNWYSSRHHCTVLNYDLRNGRRIKRFTDLFYKDTVFFPYLNDALDTAMDEYNFGYAKTEFTGLTGDVYAFSVTSVFLPDENPYLREYVCLNYDKSYYLPDLMITGKFYDMSKMLDFSVLGRDPDAINKQFRPEWYLKYSKNEDGYRYTKVMDSAFHSKYELIEFRKVFKNIVEDLKINTKSLTSINNDERSYQNTTLNVLVKTESYGHKYMYTSSGNRVWFSDIFGSEFASVNDSLYKIKNISLNASEVTIEVLGGDDGKQHTEQVIEFDPENINMDYLIPGKEKATACKLKKEYQKPVSKKDNVSAYSDSYVLDYEKTETTAELKPGTKVTVKSSVSSHGQYWYECWDAETDNYYGWIKSSDIG